ncbi:ribonuclease T2 family protein [Sphingopyxis macrogoltabida]|uniref:Ribonuclease T2 n=1 Tax=Sphingopyxis macrogoltabida TaxID=33050 RepID=A0AAC9FFL5_SPHMC|nr:ribonuclease T(2) [Sphingopyxis macrogoltabida]ALJ12712.1 ribonuclease T2 [Sphingopyxis macrogoltabida]AMU89821.1 ribonuclease T2 [Sphingopyxis macrogoltabida]
MRWPEVAALALLLAPTAANAQALACRIPDRIPVPRLEQPKRGEPVRKPPVAGYLLSMSWSPQHCATVRNPKDARDRFQCAGENGRFGWVLHGLWPEAANPGYPQWCRPAKIVPQPVLRRHLCMTPSAQLLQHEWAKHGTCMSPHPAAYFRSAEILFGAVRFPDMAALAAKPQTAGTIRRAFAAANKGVSESMIAVAVDEKGWLKEVRLCLGPRMRPQRCKGSQTGARDQRAVRVRPLPR